MNSTQDVWMYYSYTNTIFCYIKTFCSPYGKWHKCEVSCFLEKSSHNDYCDYYKYSSVLGIVSNMANIFVVVLLRGGAKLVYACEWNPNAIEALRHNLRVNGVEDRCVVLEGDNRLTAPKVHESFLKQSLCSFSDDICSTFKGVCSETE